MKNMRQIKQILKGFWPAVLFCFLFAVPASGVDMINTEFGDDGFTVKDFGIGDDEALALAVQPDGKLLAAGYSSNGAVMNMSVVRYLPDGTLDIDFNYDGVFTLSMGSGDTVARDLVVQDSGRILVVASSFDVEPGLAVVALTADGYLDAGFGDNGQVVFPVVDGAVVTADLKVAVDGSIIVGATIEGSDSTRSPFFAKMSGEGEFADDFGEDGFLRYEQDYDIESHAFVLMDEGKLLVAGSIEQDEIMHAGLLRFNSDGSIDVTFGNRGELILEIGEDGSIVNDLWAESNGSFLLAGSVGNEGFRQAFAARMMENGELDSSFGGSGLFMSNLEYDNVAHGVTVQQDGTVVLVGFGASGQGKDVIVWSIPEDNVFSFSSGDEVILDAEQQIVLRELSLREDDVELTDNDALVDQLSEFVAPPIITDIANSDDTGYALVALSSGQVVVAGSSSNGTDKDFVLVEYTSENTGAAQAGNSSGGVTTGDLKVITSPIIDVTRVGAVTGGTIFLTTRLSCETSCTEQCRDYYDNDQMSEDNDQMSEDNDQMSEYDCSITDFYAACYDPCQEKRTITKRGVVFSVYPNPTYREGNTLSSDNDDKSYVYDTVRSGQTEDGPGTGVYGSDIQRITPDVTYYVRAYGVLYYDGVLEGDDQTVIYGNQLTFKTNDACFIATAAYGTILDGHVTLLRQFRDIYLMPNSLGRKIIGVYYHFSPGIADIVSNNMLLRYMVQVVLWPFIGFALFMLKVSLTTKIAGILLAVLLGGFFLRQQTSIQKN